MTGEHGSQVVATRQYLNDTGREELLSKLTKLQVTVGSEWGWLDDDRVAGKNRRTDLAQGKVDREVPGDDTHDETKRCVSLNGHLGVVFMDGLFLELKLVKGSQPSGTSGKLSLSELGLWWLALDNRCRQLRRTGLPCSMVSSFAKSAACLSMASA